MKLYMILALILTVCCLSTAYAEEEKIDIKTYYPAPYGEYEELESDRLAIGAAGSTHAKSGIAQFKVIDDNAGSPPGSQGDIYYSEKDDEFKYHDISDWRSLGAEGIVNATLIKVKYIANDTPLITLTSSYQDVPNTDVTFTLDEDSYVMIKWYLGSGIGDYLVENDGSADGFRLGNNQWSGVPNDGMYSFYAPYVRQYNAGSHTVKLQCRLGNLNPARVWELRAPVGIEVYILEDSIVDFSS